MSEEESAAREYVAGLKASGLNNTTIAAILLFALKAIGQDPDTSAECIALLAEMIA